MGADFNHILSGDDSCVVGMRRTGRSTGATDSRLSLEWRRASKFYTIKPTSGRFYRER